MGQTVVHSLGARDERFSWYPWAEWNGFEPKYEAAILAKNRPASPPRKYRTAYRNVAQNVSAICAQRGAGVVSEQRIVGR